ncbi:acetyl-coenzyme A synthetase N-terminal domain-containing protein, partial [Pacificibacter sp. AS14]
MTTKTYSPDAAFTASAYVDRAGYDAMYAASVADPEAFWGEQGKILDWI